MLRLSGVAYLMNCTIGELASARWLNSYNSASVAGVSI